MRVNCCNLVAVCCAGLLSLGGCGSEATSPPPPAPSAVEVAGPQSSALPEENFGSLRTVLGGDDLYLAGQPSIEDLATFKVQGVKTVVSLRMPGEAPWEESVAVEAAGMDFVAIPFRGAADLDDEIFDQVRSILQDSEKRPLVLHCASANRVGAVWLPYRVLDNGVGVEEAMLEAQQAGLKSNALKEKARQYIQRKSQSGRDEAAAAGS